MKKRKFVVLVIAILLTFSLFAGGGQECRAEGKFLTVHAGSIGGGFFLIGAAMAEAWDKELPGFSVNTIAGGGAQNPITVATQDGLNIGFSIVNSIKEAYDGTGMYKDYNPNGFKNLRTIARFTRPSIFHFVLTKKKAEAADANTVTEMLNSSIPLRLNAGDRGSGGEEGVRRVIELAGSSYDLMKKKSGYDVSFSSTSDAVNSMKDGHIDAFWQSQGLGSAAIQELFLSRVQDVVLLEVSKDIIDRMVNQYGYVPFTIPAGTYPKQNQDIQTFSMDSALVVNSTMPDDIAYLLTKVVLENSERWAQAEPGMIFFPKNVQNAWKNTGCPLHDGARKAYIDLGYIKE